MSAPAAAQPAAAARKTTPHRKKFVAGYVALVASVGGAIAGLVILIAGHELSGHRTGTVAGGTSGAAAFTPRLGGELGAVEIAARVADHYRNADGSQLVNVVASRNTLQDGNLGYLRVAYQVFQPVDATKRGDSELVQLNDALQYSICGTGTSCAIPGKKTPERFSLVRREALELALDTFQSDSAVENVTVFLRPVAPPTGWEGYALVFRRDVLERTFPELLSRPVEQSLPGTSQRLTTAQLTKSGIDDITRWTHPFLYLFNYQLLGGRDALLQLAPAQTT